MARRNNSASMDGILSFSDSVPDFSRNSSRVLKPPGGGTSDIFGGSETSPDLQGRKVKTLQPNSSLVFGGEENGMNGSSSPGSPTAMTPSKQNDSHARLFGAPDPNPATPVRNRMKSNIVLGAGEEHPVMNGKTNGHAMENGHNGTNGHTNGHGDNDPCLSDSESAPVLDPSVELNPEVVTEVSRAESSGQISHEPKAHPHVRFDLRTDDRTNKAKPPAGAPSAQSPYFIHNSSYDFPIPRNPITGEGVGYIKPNIIHQKQGGNPLTGNGYAPDKPTNSGRRVPPGGYSSGLW